MQLAPVTTMIVVAGMGRFDVLVPFSETNLFLAYHWVWYLPEYREIFYTMTERKREKQIYPYTLKMVFNVF